MLDTALWSLNGGMVFFFLFSEEQQQTRLDKALAAQSQAHWQFKGPAGVSPPHHWV
jgi:hypothetical protein